MSPASPPTAAPERTAGDPLSDPRVRSATKGLDVDVLIVGAVLGPAAAGVVRMAKSLASLLPLIGGPDALRAIYWTETDGGVEIDVRWKAI